MQNIVVPILPSPDSNDLLVFFKNKKIVMNSGNSKKSIVAPIDLIDLMTFKTNDLYLQLEWNQF
jgi:hypothetical protein